MTPPAPPSPAGVLAAPALRGRLVDRVCLDRSAREAMFALLGAHFTGVDRATFDADLAGKRSVILLEDDDGTLRGFSTLAVYRSVHAGRAVTVVYSGDTIVERACWGSPTLARTWIQSVRRLTADASGDVFWLLLTSGFRTYRFLPVFFREFYPDPQASTFPAAHPLASALARERFGDRYDADHGIVRLERPQVLAGDLLEVPNGRTLDPHVAFFLERNPGYVRGDELVCLTRIHEDNLTAAGRRMLRPGRG